MRNVVILAAVLMMATGANAQTPAPELKVGDQAPDFSLPASDGKTYKLKLRSGLKYSDGKAVKASDFEHSIKRVLNLESGGSSFYLSIVGAEKYIKDGKAYAFGYYTMEEIDGAAFAMLLKKIFPVVDDQMTKYNVEIKRGKP